MEFMGVSLSNKWRYYTFVPPRVRVRATVKLSAAFFHNNKGWGEGGGLGVRRCNSAKQIAWISWGCSGPPPPPPCVSCSMLNLFTKSSPGNKTFGLKTYTVELKGSYTL